MRSHPRFRVGPIPRTVLGALAVFVSSFTPLASAAELSSTAASTTTTSFSFSNTPLIRPEGSSEPAVTVGPDRTVVVSGLAFAFFPGGTNMWRGAFGDTPAFQGPIDDAIPNRNQVANGGHDADVDIGSTGTLHVSTLVLPTAHKRFMVQTLGISSITCPNADTTDDFAHCTTQLIDLAGSDRQWVTSDGPRVYIAYHDGGESALLHVQRSDDDGLTWRRVGDPIVGQAQTTANATHNNVHGPLVADPLTHSVYAIYVAGQPGLLKSQVFNLNNVYVSRSRDGGITWTPTLVYSPGGRSSFDNVFPALAVDPGDGALYAAWSDGRQVMLSASTDQGTTWSPAGVVNVSPADTAIFPWVAARGGMVDVVYYGARALTKDDPAAEWDVYMAQSADRGTHFAQGVVSDRPNHIGPICTAGDACAGNRELLDLFEVALDPRTGLAAIAYASDTFGHRFRIDSGPTAGEYPSQEGVFTRSIITLPDREMNGPTTYVGTAGCNGTVAPPAPEDADPNRDQIAVILGASGCRFDAQAQAAINAGYEGIVVVNPFDDRLFTMIGDPRDIPGVFVGLSTGLAIFNAASVSNLSVGATGAPVSVGSQLPQVVLAQQAH